MNNKTCFRPFSWQQQSCPSDFLNSAQDFISWFYAKVYESLQKYGKVCKREQKSVSLYANMCKYMQNCSKVYKSVIKQKAINSVLKHAKVRRSVQKVSKFWDFVAKSLESLGKCAMLRKCAKGRESVPTTKRVLENLLKFEKVCKKLRECAKSWESVPKAERVCQKLRKCAKSWESMPKT